MTRRRRTADRWGSLAVSVVAGFGSIALTGCATSPAMEVTIVSTQWNGSKGTTGEPETAVIQAAVGRQATVDGFAGPMAVTVVAVSADGVEIQTGEAMGSDATTDPGDPFGRSSRFAVALDQTIRFWTLSDDGGVTYTASLTLAD